MAKSSIQEVTPGPGVVKILDLCSADAACSKPGDGTCGAGGARKCEPIRLKYCLTDAGSTLTNADRVNLVMKEKGLADRIYLTVLDTVDSNCVYADVRPQLRGVAMAHLEITKGNDVVKTSAKPFWVSD